MAFWRTIASIALAVTVSQASSSSAQSVEALPDVDSQQLAGGDEEQTAEKIDIAAVRSKIVQKTNEFREQQERSAVEVDEELQQAATEFAAFMAETFKYGHHADGRTPAERAVAAGYEYCLVLENIAYWQQSRGLASEDLGSHFFEGWRDSPEHRNNMLDPAVTQTGVGLAVSKNGNTIFAVQMFGRPESARLRIEVTNEGENPVQLVVKGESKSRQFELPAHATMTLQRCRPTRLSVADSETEQQVDESSEWVVQTDGNQPVIRPAKSRTVPGESGPLSPE